MLKKAIAVFAVSALALSGAATSASAASAPTKKAGSPAKKAAPRTGSARTVTPAKAQKSDDELLDIPALLRRQAD